MELCLTTCTFEIQKSPYGLSTALSGTIYYVPLQPAFEQRILDLCHKVVALPQESEEFEPTIQELKAALHEQLEEARTKVAKMALIVAARSDSQAAD